MRFVALFGFLLFFVSRLLGQTVDYHRFFTDGTMRVDIYHTGNGEAEIFSLDAIYEERQWPGSRHHLIDTMNLGQYLLKVYDLTSGRLIYSRGYSTIFGEWKTTAEAIQGKYRTFHETLRFPFPKRPVRMVIAGRDSLLQFKDLYSLIIQPHIDPVNRELLSEQQRAVDIQITGPDSTRVDLLFLGDGYTASQKEKFFRDVRAFVQLLFETEPYRKFQTRFNVRALFLPSTDPGIDEPAKGKWRKTALGFSFHTFGISRYVLSLDNRTLHHVASQAPYDVICVLLNTDRYGGGGIYGLYSATFTSSSDGSPSRSAGYVFLHELGHSFAGLGDEYYSASVAYQDFYRQGIEPWEPNLTALFDPKRLKWRNLVSPDTPLPTPWNKAAYDSLSRLLSRISRGENEKRDRILSERKELLKKERYWGRVGAFEGAGYRTSGLYRPSLECLMFSIEAEKFCPVCQQAIAQMIDFFTK